MAEGSSEASSKLPDLSGPEIPEAVDELPMLCVREWPALAATAAAAALEAAAAEEPPMPAVSLDMNALAALKIVELVVVGEGPSDTASRRTEAALEEEEEEEEAWEAPVPCVVVPIML